MVMIRRGLGYTIVSSIARVDDNLVRYPVTGADGKQLTNKTWRLYKAQSETSPRVAKRLAALKRRHQ